MTPQQIIAKEIQTRYDNANYGAGVVISALNTAGYIIVPKGSIGRAQKDAYYDALEDVRMGFVKAA